MVCRGQRLGLEALIDLAIQLDHLREARCTPQANEQEPSPKHVEPMDLSASLLSRRDAPHQSCFFCQSPHHFVQQCPHVKEARSSYFARKHKVSSSFTHGKCSLQLQLIIHLNYQAISFPALLDSGSEVNCISHLLVEKFQIPTKALTHPFPIYALDGVWIGKRKITHTTLPIQVQVGLFHYERISFYITHSRCHEIVLGFPWLQMHNPLIDWDIPDIVSWAPTCLQHCMSLSVPHVNSTSIESSPVGKPTTLPSCYMDLVDIFSKNESSRST